MEHADLSVHFSHLLLGLGLQRFSGSFFLEFADRACCYRASLGQLFGSSANGHQIHLGLLHDHSKALEFFDATLNRLHRMSLNLYHLLALQAAPALTCSQGLGQLLHSLLLSLLRGAMSLLDNVAIVVVEHVRWCWNGMLAAATVGGALPR